MLRREFYKHVAGLAPRYPNPADLFNAAADAMRAARSNAAISPDFYPLQSSLLHDDFLGQLYQALGAPALEAAYRATARDRRKFKPSEITAVTQLFTPRWVVEFLLQNTLGKQWLAMHPDSSLRRRWSWLIEKTAIGARPKMRSASDRIFSAADIRVCDPACGTMNFGVIALDMLRDMHREEIDRAGETNWPARALHTASQIDAHILRHQLVGYDIDPIALDLARQTLEIKLGRPIAPDEHQLSARDSLFHAGLSRDFDVVVTNPPYLSARNLDPSVVRRLKARYPSAWRDYYACFLLRSLDLLRPGGRAGVLSMQSFMFTGAFERLRNEILIKAGVDVVAHFGPGLFEIGNPGTLQTAAITFQREPRCNTNSTFIRLTDATDKRCQLLTAISSPASPAIFTLGDSDLRSLPRRAWIYWLSPPLRRAFAEMPTLGTIAPPRQGLATTDNARFVRYWWEVEPPGFFGRRPRWHPYAKGGRFRRWYEAPRHRVNWEDDGREIKQAIVDRYPYLNGEWQWVAKNSAWYGRPGITYSYLTSGSFSARRLESGTIFDVAGSALFPEDPLPMLGLLNSRVVRDILLAINPTVNFQVGDLRQLPIPREWPAELNAHVQRAIDATRQLDTFDETTTDFAQPPGWNPSESIELRRTIAEAEKQIDRIAADLYCAPSETASPQYENLPRSEVARRWISYALGRWLGRWGAEAQGHVATVRPLDARLRRDLVQILARGAGEAAAVEIQASVGGLDRFFAKDFVPWHNLLYRGRPVLWAFSHGHALAVVHGHAIQRNVMRDAFSRIGQALPENWSPGRDDGVRLALAPLAIWLADRKLQKSLRELHAPSEIHAPSARASRL